MNRSIDDSTAAATAAARLTGTSIDIGVDAIIRVGATVVGDRLVLTSLERDASSAADAVISGSLPALARAVLADGSARAGDGLEISGDAEIAAGYRTLFRLAMPDLEERLAQLIGDTPARTIHSLAARSLRYLDRLRATAGSNIAEYLQEESRDLVNRTEADEFMQGVDEARETADRVAARLRNLEQRLKGGA